MLVGSYVASVQAAEIQMQVQAAPATPIRSRRPGKLLTIEDAVRIGLDNHPRIKSANERIGSQQAMLGQQMSAYYPTISLNNPYRTTQSSTNGGNDHAADAFSSQAIFNMTLYNFGKREGNVQAARETLDATKQDYETTNQDIVLSIKQAYYVYLGITGAGQSAPGNGAQPRTAGASGTGILRSRHPGANRRRASRSQSLYSAQADLIAAENGVKIAWVTLRNAMGSPRLPEQPVAVGLARGGIVDESRGRPNRRV